MISKPIFDVSVITASFNSASTIERTIRSVQAATGGHLIQHIFIDGGSSDETLKIIEQYRREGDIVLSEPDHGISDAFNKGAMLAQGSYIHYLNSDDWADPEYWDRMIAASEGFSVPLLHGDLMIIVGDRIYRKASGSADYWKYIDHTMRGISHPAILAHRDAFALIGPFSTEFRFTMDLQWLQRAFDLGYISRHVPGARIHFSAGTGASFTPGGVVRESAMLARMRGVSALTIAKMVAGKHLRISFHRLNALLRKKIALLGV